MPAPRMLTTAEAAQALGVSTRTVCRYVTAGKLPAHRNANGDLRFDSGKSSPRSGPGSGARRP